MFEVLNKDDAWDIGVLQAAGLVKGSVKELGVPDELVEHFEAGQHDHGTIAKTRIVILASRWLW